VARSITASLPAPFEIQAKLREQNPVDGDLLSQVIDFFTKLIEEPSESRTRSAFHAIPWRFLGRHSSSHSSAITPMG
jgi:hypothetical protein